MDLADYLPIGILILMAVTFAVGNVVGSLVLGPRRDGAVKSAAYESGMAPIGTARKRFNVRFYLIAMTFLVFDVEVIFLYPWAVTYSNIAPGTPRGGGVPGACAVLHGDDGDRVRVRVPQGRVQVRLMGDR
jgi:NADH-quinone oxidoreductase subunit A